jgi:hypothetical protein
MLQSVAFTPVVARTHEIIRHHGSSPLIAQPSREQLTTALTM